MRACVVLVAVALQLALAACGTTGFLVTPSANRVLSPQSPVEAGQEIVAKENDVILRNPVGSSTSGQLDGDVTLQIAGKSETLPKGMRLVAATTYGDAAAKLPKGSHIYCSSAKTDFAKSFASLLTLGISNVATRTGATTQFCLVDGDRNGTVESAFLAGAKKAGDLAIIPVTETPILRLENVPLPGESEARIRYVGPVGLFGNIGFDLEVLESGNRLVFGNGRAVVGSKNIPSTVRLFGAVIDILEYDPKTKRAKLRLQSGLGEGVYTIQTTTTYIPSITDIVHGVYAGCRRN